MKARTLRTRVVPAVTLALAFAGCAAPSAELVDARNSYARAKDGPANTYVPDKVLEAKQALDVAEKSNDDDEDSFETKSYAYLASRKARVAIAEGNRAKVEHKLQALEEQVADEQKIQLKQARKDNELVRAKLDEATKQLEAERQARHVAEGNLSAAVTSLREFASVREDNRGIVITLDGALLFPSGRPRLLPIAKQQLARVAKALREQGDDKHIVVEGHTDSRGSARKNQELSARRAELVRDHLVRLGVRSEQIDAVGKGEESPIASNRTPDGRANNRRVEIILQEPPKDDDGKDTKTADRG